VADEVPVSDENLLSRTGYDEVAGPDVCVK
jgi:hypothetical protein